MYIRAVYTLYKEAIKKCACDYVDIEKLLPFVIKSFREVANLICNKYL